MLEENFINAGEVRFDCSNGRQLDLLFSNGEVLKNVKPKRIFPITQKNSYIDIYDANGEEVGVIRQISELDPKSGKYLEAALERYYVIPRIREILKIEEKYGVFHWKVNTSIGICEFEIQNRSTDIRVFLPRKVVIRDVDDNRYEIPDFMELPNQSFLLLQKEI